MADQVSARVRTLRRRRRSTACFDEPFDVRTAARARGPRGRRADRHRRRDRRPRAWPRSSPRRRRWRERALSVASKSSKVATEGPAAVGEGDQDRTRHDPDRDAARAPRTRHGVRELQVLASYVITPPAGSRASIPTAGWSRSLTLSLYARSRAPARPRACPASRTARRGRPAVGAAVAAVAIAESVGPGPRPAPGRGGRPARPPALAVVWARARRD